MPIGDYNLPVQTSYTDAPDAGYPGQIATIGTATLIESVPVGGDKPLIAGLGVMKGDTISVPASLSTVQDFPYEGLPVDATTTLETFVGVAVRGHGLGSGFEGLPAYPAGGMAAVMMKGEHGNRFFAKTVDAVDADDPVHMFIKDDSDHGHEIGSFTNSAVDTDTLDLSSVAKWRTAAPANSVGIIQFI